MSDNKEINVSNGSSVERSPAFWKWDGGLSPELCDLLLKDRETFLEQQASVGETEGSIDKNIRDSKICWAPTNHWSEGVLYNFGIYACIAARWDFNLSRPERVQITSYDNNGFYGWHEDWDPYAITPFVRKISVVALLTDPSEYEGGEFQMFGGDNTEMKRGTVIAFPSFARHQVTPVTSGKRVSAVCWISGQKVL
jgi:hypothetical protein